MIRNLFTPQIQIQIQSQMIKRFCHTHSKSKIIKNNPKNASVEELNNTQKKLLIDINNSLETIKSDIKVIDSGIGVIKYTSLWIFFITLFK